MKKVIAVLALVLAAGAALFFLNRPPAPFDLAELTPAETVESCPSAELSLEIDGHSLELTFQNNSDSWLASGASVDRNNDFFFHGGLDVFLDGQWYQVPSEDIVTAGVGLELEPGDSVSGAYSFVGYDQLPDGQYRFPFGYWVFDPTSDRPISEGPYYESYVTFAIQNGKYVSFDLTG